MQNVAAEIEAHLLANQNSLPPAKEHLSQSKSNIIQ